MGYWRLEFFRSLSVLLSAGIPLHSSLDFLLEQNQGKDRTVVAEMSKMLISGYRFSQALAAHGDRFEPFHINSIRVAEETGALVRTIAELEQCEKKQLEHRKLLQGKLTYPAILAVVCLLVIITVPVFCLEGLLSIISQHSESVPPLTQLLLLLNRMLTNPLLWCAAAGLFTLLTTKRREVRSYLRKSRLFWALLSLAGPLNTLRHLSAGLVFSNSLSLQLDVGLNALDAIPLAAGATGDPDWGEMGLRARDRLIEGETLYDSFSEEEFLDPIFLSVLLVGQESGKTPQLLRHYVVLCQDEIEYRLEKFLALVEPLLLLLMGFIFAFLMLATMQPMVQLVQAL